MTKAKAAAAQPHAEDTQVATAPPLSAPAPGAQAWEPVRETANERVVRGAGLAIALLLFTVAAIIALYNAMRIASIWFEPRFVPIVQFVLAGAVMFACFVALRRLKR